MEKNVAARIMAMNFAERGFKNTAKWIIFSLKNKDSPLTNDLLDILYSFKFEFRHYREEYIDSDPNYNEECFETIMSVIAGGMSCDKDKFHKLTAQLIPLNERIIENNKGMDNLLADVKNLKLPEAFHRYCHYYQMLWEGDYKFVRKNLIAMKSLREGKNVSITDTLSVAVDSKKVESPSLLEDIIPVRLKTGDHTHLRNSIAHYNFRFIGEEEKMEFWDIDPRTQNYSWGPKKYSLREFSKPLIEVNLFCEAFGLIALLMMALSDLSATKLPSES